MTIKVFYDTEFIDDGRLIELISIGLVTEDGHELYMQSTEFNVGKASDWLLKNVMGNIELCPSGSSRLEHSRILGGPCGNPGCPWFEPSNLRSELTKFLHEAWKRDAKLELWGYYSAYDHVALAQIFGAMIELPSFVPMYTHDLKQWCDALGNPKLPEQTSSEHNALCDARWVRDAWNFLSGLESQAN